MPVGSGQICACGCGGETEISRYNSPSGQRVGQALRYINGHNARKPRTWCEEEVGFKTPCWRWQGTINTEGYGVLRENYRQHKAHRWVAEQMGRPFQAGRPVDHLCRNRWCVNPDHLESVDTATNVRRGDRARLSGYEVVLIRLLTLTTPLRYSDIAEIVGCSPANVGSVLGRHWRLPIEVEATHPWGTWPKTNKPREVLAR